MANKNNNFRPFCMNVRVHAIGKFASEINAHLYRSLDICILFSKLIESLFQSENNCNEKGNRFSLFCFVFGFAVIYGSLHTAEEEKTCKKDKIIVTENSYNRM